MDFISFHISIFLWKGRNEEMLFSLEKELLNWFQLVWYFTATYQLPCTELQHYSEMSTMLMVMH